MTWSRSVYAEGEIGEVIDWSGKEEGNDTVG